MIQYFTHEKLNNKFKNKFDLINYAIKISQLHIKEGEDILLADIVKELEALPELEKE